MHNEEDEAWGRYSAACIKGIFSRASKVYEDLNSRIYRIPANLKEIPTIRGAEQAHMTPGWRETMDRKLELVRFFVGHGWLNENQAYDADLLDLDENGKIRRPFHE